MATRVLLVEDNAQMREALRRVLHRAPDFELAGEAEETDQAVLLAGETEPDVVLMDLRIPGAGGIAATRAIKRKLPRVMVVGWTAYADRDFLKGMLEAGASGYLLKGSSGESFLSSLRAVVSGGMPISPAIAGEIVRELRSEIVEEADAKGPSEGVGALASEAAPLLESLVGLAEMLSDPAVRRSDAGERIAQELRREAHRLGFLVEDLLSVGGLHPKESGTLTELAGRAAEAVRTQSPGVLLRPAVDPEAERVRIAPWLALAVWRRMATVAARGRSVGEGALHASSAGRRLVLGVTLHHAGEARPMEVEGDPELRSLFALVRSWGGEVTQLDLGMPTVIRVSLPGTTPAERERRPPARPDARS